MHWTIGSGYTGKWREDSYDRHRQESGRIFCKADQLIGGNHNTQKVYRIVNSATIEGSGGEYYFKTLSSVTRSSHPQKYKLQISYLEDIPSLGVFFLTDSLLNDGSQIVTGIHRQPFDSRKDSKISFQADYETKFGSYKKTFNKIRIDASYTRFFKAVYYEPDYSFFNDSGCFLDYDANHRETGGSTVSFAFNAGHEVTLKFRHSLNYRFTVAVSGEQFFLDTWKKFPAHKINYSVSIKPDKTFVIRGRLTYASNTVWVDLCNLDDSVECKLEPVYYCDLSFGKKFWQGKVDGSLNFRNVLNKKVKYHTD